MTAGRILILGGYGSTGRPLARLLLAESNAELILAGRRLERAQAAAEALNAEFPGQRVIGARVDAADPRQLRAALDGVPLVVAASSTAALAGPVAQAALAAGCDYYDLQYSAGKLAALRALEPAIRAAGRCFITDGGFHPGLPAAMIRYAAPRFDRLEAAVVASVIKLDWAALDLSPATVEEFVQELRDYKSEHYTAGRWRPAGWRDMLWPRTMDFGEPWGRQAAMPMFLEELRALPEQYPALREVGFFVGGFNWFVDGLVMPLLIGGLAVAPRRGVRPLGRLLRWGLDRFSRPPYGTLLRLEARGTLGGAAQTLTLTIGHADGYALTAIPAAACLRQYLAGGGQPGLWLQAQWVEPEAFVRDLARLGATVQLAVNGQPAAGLDDPMRMAPPLGETRHG